MGGFREIQPTTEPRNATQMPNTTRKDVRRCTSQNTDKYESQHKISWERLRNEEKHKEEEMHHMCSRRRLFYNLVRILCLPIVFVNHHLRPQLIAPKASARKFTTLAPW